MDKKDKKPGRPRVFDKKKRVELNFEEDFLNEIDNGAKFFKQTRVDFIKDSISLRLLYERENKQLKLDNSALLSMAESLHDLIGCSSCGSKRVIIGFCINKNCHSVIFHPAGIPSAFFDKIKPHFGPLGLIVVEAAEKHYKKDPSFSFKRADPKR